MACPYGKEGEQEQEQERESRMGSLYFRQVIHRLEVI